MKKQLLIFLTAPLLLYFGHCNGQTSKGSFLIGGSVSIQNTDTDVSGIDQESFSLSINPNVSYFLVNNLAIGILFPYSFTNDKTSDNKTTSLRVGPQVRYYFIFSQLGIFVRAGYNFGKINYDGQIFDIISGELITEEIEGDQTSLNLGVGASYFINNNIGLEAIVSYDRFETDYDAFFNDFTSKTLQLLIGLQFYLSKD